MSGKKAAKLFIGFILFVVIAIVVTFQIFYAVYEPKNNEETEIINDME